MSAPAIRAKVRLRKVVGGDFRTSEATMMGKLPRAFLNTLRGNDAVCFISGSYNQVAFVYGFKPAGTIPKTSTRRARTYEMVTSVKVRLTGSQFDPLALADYAKKAGIHLEGLKLFKDRYSYLLEQRNTRRRKARKKRLSNSIRNIQRRTAAKAKRKNKRKKKAS